MAGTAHDLAAAYALDALEPRDARAYERHVDGCTVCRAQVRELGAAAAVLALAVPPVEPPTALRGRVLADASRAAPVVALRRGALAVAAVAAAALLLLVARPVLDPGPGERTIALDGARGSLVVAKDGSARLVVDRLPPAPPGRTYEAWVVSRDGAVPGGLFHGGGHTVAPLFRRVPRGSQVAVTLERAGGVARMHGRALFRTRGTA